MNYPHLYINASVNFQNTGRVSIWCLNVWSAINHGYTSLDSNSLMSGTHALTNEDARREAIRNPLLKTSGFSPTL